MGEDGRDDGPAGTGQAIPVIVEHTHHVLGGWELLRTWNRRSVHTGEG
jgi:hypothetical protein